MKEILLTSSVLIVVILLARLLFRGKVSQRLIYAAWLLVALRLLIPIQFGQSQYSITTLTEKIENNSKPIQQVQEAMDEPVAGPSREELYDQLVNEYIQQSPTPDLPEIQESITPEVQEQIEEQVEQRINVPTLSELLTTIWIVGMSAMAAWFITANVIYLRWAKQGAVPLSEIDAPIPVRISPHVPTPCLVGFFRPVIYMTPASVENAQTRNHVLTHELTHLRHWDHVWALIRCLCLCIYWFDPLVWIAAHQSRRDCELACDESTLKKLGDEERIAYGHTLLATVVQSVSPFHLIETPTSMNETKKQLIERVTFIANKPKTILIAAICMILVVAPAAGCTFLGSVPTGTDDNSNSADFNGKITRPGYKLVYLMTEMANYDFDGKLSNTYSYSYDDIGLLRHEEYTDHIQPSNSYSNDYTYTGNGFIPNTTYVFDENGSLLSYEINSDIFAYHYKFEYDQLGRLILRTKQKYNVYSDYNKLIYTEYNLFIYDANGRLYKILTPHTGVTPDVKDSVFTYDGQGRLVHSTAEQTSYVYDEEGNLVQTISRGNHMRNFKYTYENGVLTGIEHIVENFPDDQETYKMDGHGNVACVSWADGSRAEFKYVAVEMPDEFADRVLRYRHVSGMASTVDAYYDDIVLYFLPYTKPHLTSIDRFGRPMY